MSDESKICPYAGLRPFSEEESLYFKGRDEHIEQATKQLGKNKFLILTGASGDGKSSLVYAGIVPNARAGFLKSTYSNWAVADFRPERTPFQNLCKSIAAQLDIPQVETVKSELSHGFSALVDLYKASSLYYNEHEVEADEKGKTILKRKAANLLILADQFEEFFTNPENYHKGIPSSEASLVTNLLIETAQIALEENLPIYVVITMRSDFIGQCAAFRGLPEYIGFSQFFVPRLNRKQLQEVIEEPARLNGDKISRRLSERLIHDMIEGTDQLPILQHTLNQIWKMAGDGEEEMDLIHYAMVGGMEGASLPLQDIQKFTSWFADLSEKIKSCYDIPDLQNVLNTHANVLFNQAEDYVKEKYGITVSDKDARLIIETTFRCLTKIDNGRAVRNRMSLGEITSILNQHHLNEDIVGKVLGIFREPGNTLLKPYIDDSQESIELKKETVLDITHESLIRNWEHLGEWAAQEFANYTTFIDFEQQLNRWVASGKSNSFLLYIGPLTYFENWFDQVKPSAAWITRYLKEEENADQRQLRSEKILSNAIEFLHRSARKHWATRTVMKYGPRRIAAVVGIIGLLVLTSFATKNYVERRNAYVLAEIKENVFELANNPNLLMSNRVEPILGELRLRQTNVKEVVSRIDDPLEKINVATGIASYLSFFAQTVKGPAKEIDESFATADSVLDNFTTPPANIASLTRLLEENNDLINGLKLRYYYSRDPEINQLIAKNAKRAGSLALYILKNQPAGFTTTIDLNSAIEHGLNHQGFSTEQIKELIAILSPFVNRTPGDWLKRIYDKAKFEGRGLFPVYGVRFNGLYQELAYLYGSLGDTEFALKCVDTLLYYNQNYHQNEYTSLSDNASNIPVYFYLYGHFKETDDFVKGYCKKKNMAEEEFYSRLLARSVISDHVCTTPQLIEDFTDLYHNTNLEFGSDDQLKFFFDAYRGAVNATVKDRDAENLDLAVSYKNEALIYNKRSVDAGLTPDAGFVKTEFDHALALYRKVSPRYLNEPIQFIDNFVRKAPRKTLFTYPDFISSFHPWETRGFAGLYFSGAFLDYILKMGLLKEFIDGIDGARNFEIWISEYDRTTGLGAYFGASKVDSELLARLAYKIAENASGRKIEATMLHLRLANEKIQNGKLAEAMGYYELMNPNTLHEYLNSANNPNVVFAQIASGIASLMMSDKVEMANSLIATFPSSINKATLYANAAKVIALNQSKSPVIQVMLDSCRRELDRDETRASVSRTQFAYALAARGAKGDLDEAMRVMKNVGQKSAAYLRICLALGYHGDLHEAIQFIPANISDGNRAAYLTEILTGRILAGKNESVFWKKYEVGQFWWINEQLFYN